MGGKPHTKEGIFSKWSESLGKYSFHLKYVDALQRKSENQKLKVGLSSWNVFSCF